MTSQQFGNFSMFYDGYQVNWPNCQSMSMSKHFFGKFSAKTKTNKYFIFQLNVTTTFNNKINLHCHEIFSNNSEGLAVLPLSCHCSASYQRYFCRMFGVFEHVQLHHHFAIEGNEQIL